MDFIFNYQPKPVSPGNNNINNDIMNLNPFSDVFHPAHNPPIEFGINDIGWGGAINLGQPKPDAP